MLKQCKQLDEICKILAKYGPEDVELFKETVDELCKNGIGKGCFQDYGVLSDVLSIFTHCESLIKNKVPEKLGDEEENG